MKVILKKSIEQLGSYGDTITVAGGYGRNYLIPKGFAIVATPGNLRQLNSEKEAYQKKETARKAEAQKHADKLSEVSLSFARKVGEEEKLFGSVTPHDIEVELKAQGFELERKSIQLDDHIKTLGSHTVSIKVAPEVIAEITVEVVNEDGPEESEEEPKEEASEKVNEEVKDEAKEDESK